MRCTWLAAILTAPFVVGVGCSDRAAVARDSASLPAPAADPVPAMAAAGTAPDTMGARVSAAQVASLRWIAGSWKGTGDVAQPFYERYTFENDSTLTVFGFADSTLAAANDTTVFSLQTGRFGNHAKPMRWVADTLAGGYVHFAPVNARNAFSWRRVGPDRWEATISFPATAAQAARERRYTMSRLAR